MSKRRNRKRNWRRSPRGRIRVHRGSRRALRTMPRHWLHFTGNHLPRLRKRRVRAYARGAQQGIAQRKLTAACATLPCRYYATADFC